MTTKNKQRLVLFDAHAIVHRAYHALPDFTSSAGEPTGGLYGLATMLMKIIGELKPDYLAAGYDRADETFRKQAYAGYKAKRAKTEDDLIIQLERSRDVFTAFGIPIYDSPGFEADDIIGTIVAQLKKAKDLEVIIASGDMDTTQLVADDRVMVYTLKKGLSDTILYNEARVVERYGFAPKFLPDYKGLSGDQSDNIIGVAGIGEKSATELIKNFGSIESIYKQLKKDKTALETAGIRQRTIELLEAGEEEALFSKMLATIRPDAPIKFTLPAKPWRETYNKETATELFRVLGFRSLIGRAAALNGAKKEVQPPVEVEPPKVNALELKKAGIALWLIDSSKISPDLEDVLNYSGAKNLSEALVKLEAELKTNKLDKVYREIELPLIPILERAAARGVLVDRKYLTALSKNFHRGLSVLERKIFAAAGGEFNLNSPKQLGEVLFDKLHLTAPRLKKTAGGARSTRESELIKLAEGNKIVGDILASRELQKILSTYVDNLPMLLNKNDRLHTKLNQAGTTTGRMSSSEPNLQNIPIRDEQGALVRNAFLASPGFRLMDFDYSQIEMRVLAILSGDSELARIFRAGEDVHSAVAALVFGVPENEVTKEMRRRAKVINFGIIYGMGVNALKQNLGSTREEAQKFYDDYFAKLPAVRDYFETVKREARKRGYTETYFGRRRYFPELQSQLPFVRASGERMAMNAPLQGTAADIVKLAMIRAEAGLRQAGLADQAFLLLQIHDELLYEVKAGAVEEVLPIIKEAMEGVMGKSPIPLATNSAVGNKWGELK